MAKRNSGRVKPNSNSKKRKGKDSAPGYSYETLEPRRVLDAVPVGNPDPQFVTEKNTPLVVQLAEGVLANDFDAEGQSLTAVSATSTSSGQLSFNSDGTFTYTPNNNFVGRDSFTYRVSDGTNNSPVTRVDISVGQTFSAKLNGNERGPNNLLHSGGHTLSLPLSNTHQLNHRSDLAESHTIIPIETIFNGAPTGAALTSVVAELTFNGVTQTPKNYKGISQTFNAGDKLRFVLSADTTSLVTGMYNWVVKLTANFSNGAASTDTYFSGSDAVVNLADSDFGKGYSLSGYDRLYEQSNGALIVDGNGDFRWFLLNTGNNTYSMAEGDTTFSVLTKTPQNTFVLTDKWGNTRNFDSSGRMTSIKRVNNSNSTFTFAYAANKLSSITDEFGRVATLAYNSANGKLESFNGFQGRTASFGFNDVNNPNSPTDADAPDPNLTPVGPQAPTPSRSITYESNGSGRIASMIDPDGNETKYFANNVGGLSYIEHPDGSTWFLSPSITQGLSSSLVFRVEDKNANYKNERGKTFSYETDNFGNLVRFTDALGAVSNWDYSPASLLYRSLEADPDGAGPIGRSESKFGHNHFGSVVKIVNPDASNQSFTVNSLQRVLTHSNELGETTTYSYDSVGNLLTRSDALNHNWSYTYDSYGQVLTEASPDPDGGGSQLPITTTYEYESTIYTNLKKITNADGSTKQFTNDSNDNVETVTDELGRVTTYTYDNLNRLLELELPALTAAVAVYTYEYDVNGRLSVETDPEGNKTTYDYNNRNWLITETGEDPDGAGPNTRPITRYFYDELGLIGSVNVTSLIYGKTRFEYDDNGRRITTFGRNHFEEYTTTYDAMGRVLTTGDSSGRVTSYEYDNRSRLIKQTDQDPDGAGPQTSPVTQFSYDLASRLVSETDPLGRQTTYTYLSNGWLDKATSPDPDGSGPQASSILTNTYDALGRVIATTDPLGRTSSFEFNNRNWLIKSTSPNSSIFTQYSYDLAGRLTSVAEPMGRTTNYQYDALDRQIQVTMPDPDGAGSQLSPVYSYEYDLVGNVTKSIDALGRETTTQYDSLYRPIQVTEPDPGGGSPTWAYEYDGRHLLSGVVDPLGHRTEYEYDFSGRKTKVKMPDPDGAGPLTQSEYSYEYDIINRLTKVIEPDVDGAGPLVAPETVYEYDLLSRLAKVTDARGGITEQTYNAAGELIALTDPLGNATRWSYDGLGRQVLETNALGNTNFQQFDLNGNLVKSIDRNGRIVKHTHDTLDRLLTEKWYTVSGAAPVVSASETTQGTSGTNEVQTLSFTQLSASNPGTFVLGFDGQTTAPIAWNANAVTVKQALVELDGIETGDLIVTGPTFSGGTRSYSVEFTGALGNMDQPLLFGAGQLDNDPTNSNWNMNWFYDNASRLTAVSDPGAIYQYVYDNLDRRTQETQNSSSLGLIPHVRLGTSFDAVGNRTQLSGEFINGATTTKDFSNSYLFDGLDRNYRVTQTSQGSGAGFNDVADKRVNLVRNKNGQLTFLDRFENTTGTGTSLRSIFSYDSANRITNIDHRNIGVFANLSNYAFQYDLMNRFTSIQHTGSVVSDGLSTYTHDATSQLTGADHIPARPDESFQYDANGNRTGSGHTVGSNNQTLNDGIYSYVYDAEGNRVLRIKLADNSYEVSTYDHRNRLTKVSFRNSSGVEQKSVSYTYDIYNRMVRRRLDSNGPVAGGITDEYFAGFDGINPAFEFTKTNPGSGLTESDLSNRYLWGPAVDQLFADEQISTAGSAGNTLWPLADQVGTLKDIVDFDSVSNAFSVVNHRTFDSFGNITAESNASIDLAFSYTGKFLDGETQLSYHWNRWYDPGLGKWVSEDPIGFSAGDANLTRYVGNNVASKTDPTGLFDGIVVKGKSGKIYRIGSCMACHGNPDIVVPGPSLFEALSNASDAVREESQILSHNISDWGINTGNPSIAGAAAGAGFMVNMGGSVASIAVDPPGFIEGEVGRFQENYATAEGRYDSEIMTALLASSMYTGVAAAPEYLGGYHIGEMRPLTENEYTDKAAEGIMGVSGVILSVAGPSSIVNRGDAVAPNRPLGARGPISGRDFDPTNAGGPIRNLTTDRIKVTNRGVDYAERHLSRFGPDGPNQAMVQRLRDIADGKIKPTQADLNFYSHELRESVRYRRLGQPTGQPLDGDTAYDLWNNAHTATLEDYGLREGPGVLYHPSTGR